MSTRLASIAEHDDTIDSISESAQETKKTISLLEKYFPSTTMIIIAILLATKSLKIDVNKVYNLEYYYEYKDEIILYSKVLVIILILTGLAYLIALAVVAVRTRMRQKQLLKLALQREREQLIRFYHALNGQAWKDNTRWCSDSEPVHKWQGVKVSLTFITFFCYYTPQLYYS